MNIGVYTSLTQCPPTSEQKLYVYVQFMFTWRKLLWCKLCMEQITLVYGTPGATFWSIKYTGSKQPEYKLYS